MSLIPSPSALTKPFWDATASHKLVRPVCRQCGKNFFTPQIACPRCRSQDWEWVESNGKGTVYSAVVVYRPPEPGFSVPYILAIVNLDEGWNMLSNIVNCPISMKLEDKAVRLCWQQKMGDFTLPTFQLAEGAL